MLLETGGKLVMIGDSVTDCGRARPVGERSGLGGGYPLLVDQFLQAAYPERRIRVVNTGISGNTVRDLKKRWQTDVLDLQPQYVSVMIGVNDVWRQFDAPLQTEIHVLPEEYAETLDALAAATTPVVKRLVLMSPFFAEPNPDDLFRQKIDTYGKIVAATAARYNAIWVDTQAAFCKHLQHLFTYALAPDRVHPTGLGHMILAKAFLKAIAFEWEKFYD